MSARSWDLGLGVTFAIIGSALVVGGWRMPDGVGGIPGPGFFPMLVGAVLAALGCSLARSGRSGADVYWTGGWSHPPLRQTLAILVLLVAYVALWEAVPFLIRTPVLLLAISRVVGEPWLRAALLALLTTTILAGVFELLLRVRL